MSHKMSRKAQLLAQLAKDESFKDAFRLIATKLANNPEFNSLSLADSIFSSDSEEEISDEDLSENVSDEDLPELSDSKCGQPFQMAVNGKTETKTINKCEQKASNQSESLLNKLKQKISPIVFENDYYDSDDNDEASDCEDSQQLATNGQKVDEMTEEEKRKRRNEKKRLQKKKKRDKRKAEKQSNVSKEEPNGANKSEANKTNDNKNNNNKNNKKLEMNIKSENNSNTKNKHKTETKTVPKGKENSNNDKTSDPKHKNKETEQKNVSKCETSSNGRNSGEPQSAKSSPKSDRESDQIQSDVEEEELLLSSAYVAQIAQRKNKPTVYQKTAQTLNDAQDFGDDYSVAKHKNINSDNISNNYDFVIKNSSQNNPNNPNTNPNNQNKSVLSNNSREVDDFPKFKQYFFEKPKPSKTANTPLTKEEKTLNIEKSVEMAILANHRAENSLFVEAIDLFSQAIGFNPKDYRFYVNRSYCYDSIQDFRNALKDAEIAIKLKPDWPKCHYRKGKALAGLKNYAESEIALKKVLTLESDCVEAIQDLRQVRYSAIIDMGYDSSTAELYSSNYDSINDALNALSLRQEKQKSLNTVISNKTANNLKKGNNWWNSANNSKNTSENGGARAGQVWDDDDIFISDDEFNSVREPTFEETSPTNPFGWKALWVGNVSLNAKLDTVTTMFRKFGNLNYCNIFKGNNGGNFILVHYDNADSPTLAMSKYQGKVIPGVSIADTPLTIRFRPNKDQKKPNYDQRLESDECYYWRTTGCARGDNCLYKHIQANKGVDKQAWMCNPLRKNPFQKPQK